LEAVGIEPLHRLVAYQILATSAWRYPSSSFNPRLFDVCHLLELIPGKGSIDLEYRIDQAPVFFSQGHWIEVLPYVSHSHRRIHRLGLHKSIIDLATNRPVHPRLEILREQRATTKSQAPGLSIVKELVELEDVKKRAALGQPHNNIIACVLDVHGWLASQTIPHAHLLVTDSKVEFCQEVPRKVARPVIRRV
jgi:hypothetical protein